MSRSDKADQQLTLLSPCMVDLYPPGKKRPALTPVAGRAAAAMVAHVIAPVRVLARSAVFWWKGGYRLRRPVSKRSPDDHPHSRVSGGTEVLRGFCRPAPGAFTRAELGVGKSAGNTERINTGQIPEIRPSSSARPASRRQSHPRRQTRMPNIDAAERDGGLP